jgi:hypothetical protein
LSYFEHSNDDPSERLDAARVRDLLANLSCPLCAGTRESSLLVVIDGPRNGTTVRAQCVRCHLFWSFTLDPELGPTAPVATRRGRLPEEPISADEVIELHQLLDHYEGSLTDLVWRTAS